MTSRGKIRTNPQAQPAEAQIDPALIDAYVEAMEELFHVPRDVGRDS